MLINESPWVVIEDNISWLDRFMRTYTVYKVVTLKERNEIIEWLEYNDIKCHYLDACMQYGDGDILAYSLTIHLTKTDAMAFKLRWL